VAAYAALTYVVPAALSFSPVLLALSAFALLCSLFVAFQFLMYVLNIVARIHVAHRSLVLVRAVYTVFAITLPLLGALLGSATGAIWCFAATTPLAVVLWLALLIRTARELEEISTPAPPTQAG
jgi:hypothetical protein